MLEVQLHLFVAGDWERVDMELPLTIQEIENEVFEDQR